MSHSQQASTEAVGDPDVALTVDGKTTVVDSGLEVLGLARIGGWKAGDVRSAAVGHPDSVLLVDAEVKRSYERLARLRAVALANDAAVSYIALGEVTELPILDTQYPNITARRDDDTLHQTEAAIEIDALRWCQGLAVLVEYRDGFAAIAGQPCIVFRVDCRTESTPFHSGRPWWHGPATTSPDPAILRRSCRRPTGCPRCRTCTCHPRHTLRR